MHRPSFTLSFPAGALSLFHSLFLTGTQRQKEEASRVEICSSFVTLSVGVSLSKGGVCLKNVRRSPGENLHDEPAIYLFIFPPMEKKKEQKKERGPLHRCQPTNPLVKHEDI